MITGFPKESWDLKTVGLEMPEPEKQSQTKFL